MTNEEMSLRTKEALSSALKSLMTKKPLSKITVSELIKACNINRNTFYYHFQDIYDLLKWTLEQEAIEVIKSMDLFLNPKESINFILDYIEENQHIIACAYDSLGYEHLKRFFYKDVYEITRKLVDTADSQRENPLPSSRKEFVTMFFTEAIAGCLIHYIQFRETWSREETSDSLVQILLGAMNTIARESTAILAVGF